MKNFIVLLLAAMLGNWGNEAANLQMCIENFVVHADKIIRTQDSRALGAKYLTEADVPSRDDCLQMCCETPTCDVFVFELKRGSCYLFHCGDPQDFKCKFTQHKNYSSGVLMPSNELETQIKLTKHEDELAQLSKKVESAVPTAVPQSTMHPPATSVKPPNTAVKNINATGSPCSRYQFECRTSHECIAIYNACDGITQCPDGSDEGPELDCPALTGTVRPHISEHRQQLPVPKTIAGTSDFKKNLPMHSQEPYALYSEKQAMEAQQELTNHAKTYGREGEGGAPLDSPSGYRAYAEQLRKPQDEQSRIFNHKGGLNTDGDRYNNYYHQIRTNSNEGMPMGPYVSDSARDYQKPGQGSNYYGNAYQPYNNWPARQREDSRWNYPGPPPPDYYYEESQMRRIAPGQPAQPIQQQSFVIKNGPSQPVQQANVEKTTLTKMEEGKIQEKETTSVKKVIVETTAAPTVIAQSTKAVPTHEKLEMNEDDFVVLEEDGENERPRGAVLSLALGMCIAAIMITLVGCRLRVVQKRLRRGGKRYAHDADFLVNGMYL